MERKTELNSEVPVVGDAGAQPNRGDVKVLDALAWTGACFGPKGEEKIAGVAPKTSVVVEEEATGELPTSGIAKALFPNSEPELCACIVPIVGGVGAANVLNPNLGVEAGDCTGPELTDVMVAEADPKLNSEEL